MMIADWVGASLMAFGVYLIVTALYQRRKRQAEIRGRK
jgi:hypothetical protein